MVNGLSGERMLIGLAIGIAVLIVLVLKTKIQAFLALVISTVVVGVIGGMPLTNITIEVDGVEKTFGIVNSITSGFGGTLGSIGIIIGFGVMMGQIFEVTGAAKRMAHTFLKLFGKKREEEALALTGFLVSIPIFCDSGFVVLAPIAKAISKATKKSVIGLGTALAAGLVITHSLVPPTPGPVLVAEMLNVELSYVIILGIIIGIPAMILAGPVFGKFAGNNIPFMKPAQLVVAFLVAAAVRVSVGSATVSMTMAAGIIASMPMVSGLSQLQLATLTIAIAAGGTAFSHVNDSGFWLSKSLFEVDEKTNLKTWTVMETIVGLVGIVGATIVWFIVS